MFLCVIPTSDKNYLVVPRSGEKKKLIKTKLIKKKNVMVLRVLEVQRTKGHSMSCYRFDGRLQHAAGVPIT